MATVKSCHAKNRVEQEDLDYLIETRTFGCEKTPSRERVFTSLRFRWKVEQKPRLSLSRLNQSRSPQEVSHEKKERAEDEN